MRSVNRICLLGNVGRDPEARTTTSGKKVCSFSIATSVKTGDTERTEWHRISAWDQLADLAEKYVKKGDRLYVEGEMRYSSYEKNGTTIPTAEVHLRELVMLGLPPTEKPAKATAPSPFDDDDADDFRF